MTRHLIPKPAPRTRTEYKLIAGPDRMMPAHLLEDPDARNDEMTLRPGTIRDNRRKALRLWEKYTKEYVGRRRISLYERRCKGNNYGEWKKIK